MLQTVHTIIEEFVCTSDTLLCRSVSYNLTIQQVRHVNCVDSDVGRSSITQLYAFLKLTICSHVCKSGIMLQSRWIEQYLDPVSKHPTFFQALSYVTI